MKNPVDTFEDVRQQRERELRGMTAEELHLRLMQDSQVRQDFEGQVIYARMAEVQTQEIINQLIAEKGGAVVYLLDFREEKRDGVVLSVTKGRGFESRAVVLNPTFAAGAEENDPAPRLPSKKSFRKIPPDEANRRWEQYGINPDHDEEKANF